jgi:ATP-dependent RNA helicase DDX35
MSSVFWKPSSTNDLILRGEEGGGSSTTATVQLYAPPPRGPLARQRLLLPIYKHKRQILYAVETHGVTVIVGETGCGKSSQIPQYLVEGGWTQNDFAVVCTQPRRIAASSLATRVAQEMNCPLGDQVGYTVRFDDQTSPQTIIKVRKFGTIILYCVSLSHSHTDTIKRFANTHSSFFSSPLALHLCST